MPVPLSTWLQHWPLLDIITFINILLLAFKILSFWIIYLPIFILYNVYMPYTGILCYMQVLFMLGGLYLPPVSSSQQYFHHRHRIQSDCVIKSNELSDKQTLDFIHYSALQSCEIHWLTELSPGLPRCDDTIVWSSNQYKLLDA